MDRTDDRVGGRYRLLELIGSGGMGRVWRAEDDLLLRTVAVKEITVASAAPLVAEAMREARAAARLDHPGVVKVFDVVWRQGRCWIVMEYVESRSLQQVIREDGPLPYREVARIGLEVLAALRTAHAAGVLHRDVKPDNVLLAADGRVVLTDFGLATIGGADDGPDPRLGSPSFIAPERLDSGDAGVASDLWSFGAMLYAAAEGRPPFARADAAASLRALLTDPPDAAQRSGPLSALILGLLDKDPARRPSADDVESRLRTVRNGRPARRRARLILAAFTVLGLAGTVTVVGRRAEPGPGPGFMATAAMDSSSPDLLPGGSPAPVHEPGGSTTPAHEPGGSTTPAHQSGGSPAPVLLAGGSPSPCGSGGTAVAAATGDVPANLPPGWIWFRDPTGFGLALPAGWRRSPHDTDSPGDDGVCFADPTGRQALTVQAVPAADPLTYWRKREAAGRPSGYTRVSMGAAGWEYTWHPAPTTTRHERRVLTPAAGNRSYLLRWRVADADWPATRPVQRGLIDLFRSAA